MEQGDYSAQGQPGQIQQTQVSQVQRRTAPLRVKILAILSWIGAVLMILSGLIFLSLPFFLDYIITKRLEELPTDVFLVLFILVNSIGGFIWILGGLLLILGIINIFIAKGLWKGKNWARVFLIVLMILWTIIWSIELFKGYFLNLIVIGPSLIILFYLFFSKKVKSFFKGV